jgi:hypothetical protein
MGLRAWKARPTRRARHASQSAEMIDEIVDSQLTTLPLLDEARRERAAEHLAELVMLAQAYRHLAAGWISEAEVGRRANAVVHQLERDQDRSLFVQLAERDRPLAEG